MGTDIAMGPTRRIAHPPAAVPTFNALPNIGESSNGQSIEPP